MRSCASCASRWSRCASGSTISCCRTSASRVLRPWSRRDAVLARPVDAARGAPAPRARGAGPDLRQVRADAVDAPRPASARHRRRAREAAGPRAAVPGRAGDRDARRARYRKPVDEVFASFDREPTASASVAQVHFAQLPDGTPVAVKVLRPGIEDVIAHDLALLDTAAALVERVSADARRLRPRDVVEGIRKDAARRARPDARGRQLLAAAPQLPSLAAAARPGDPLGLHERRKCW